MPVEESAKERISRLRDNKRRQRERQKGYVADLERRLEESRLKGVEATKEVQISAQRVVKENLRLRELLRHAGYSSEAIDAWVWQDEAVTEGRSCQNQPYESALIEPDGWAPPVASIEQFMEPMDNVNERCSKTGRVGNCSDTTSNADTSREEISESSTPPVLPDSEFALPIRRPCQIASLLAENPSVDIDQVPMEGTAQPQNKKPCSKKCSKEKDVDGIECATAYKMLMSYATSSERADEIALALKEGCMPTEGGGCKVKTSVAWEVLEKSC